MKKMILIFYLGFNWALAESISLEDCFLSAGQHHPLMKQKNPINRITENQLKNLQTKWYPSSNLNLTATYQSEVTKLDIELPPTISSGFHIPSPDKDNYRAEIEIDQLLFDGGLVSVQKKLTKQENKISLQQIDANFLTIKSTIAEVFYSLLMLEKQAKILATWREDLEKSRKQLTNLVSSGIREKSDIYEIDIKLQELEQQIEENKIFQQNSRRILTELTGMEITPTMTLYIPTEIQFDFSISNAQTILYSYQLEKLEIAKKINFRNRLPKVFSFGKLGYGKPGLNMLSNEADSYYSIGIALQWNIWDWHTNKREKEKLNYNQQMIRFTEEAYQQNTRIEMEKYKTAILNLKQKIEKDRNIFNLHKKLKATAETKFKNGVMNTTDYLIYNNNFIRAELALEIHKIQLYQEKVNYQILKGEL